MKNTAAWADASAITLSGLCLLHCLALPVLATLLPLLGAWSEAEWLHLLFVLIALPLTSYTLWRAHRRHRLPAALWGLATTGLTLLLAGAFGWPAHVAETPLTVAGSLMLAGTHMWNALRRRHVHG